MASEKRELMEQLIEDRKTGKSSRADYTGVKETADAHDADESQDL